MIRWVSALLLATVLAVLFLVFPRPQMPLVSGESGFIRDNSHVLPEPWLGTAAKEPETISKRAGKTNWKRQGAVGPIDTSTVNQAYLGPFAPGVRLDGWLEEYFFTIQDQSANDMEVQRNLAGKGDANAAFWMYVYCVHCLAGPRTDCQLERKLAEYEGMLNEPNISDEQASQVTQGIENLYAILELCSDTVDNNNLRSEALQWLHTAADLGHMGARRLYHYYARWLILGNGSGLAFEYPGLVQEFQERAKTYANSILALGHVQAYVLLSEMYFAGDVYPRDFMQSYAYALAAEEIEGDQLENTTRMRLRRVEYRLSPREKAEARKLASTLVAQLP
ncbi:MAG: hypothetical protein AAF358_11590 [Pseudomonadota bacterium]